MSRKSQKKALPQIRCACLQTKATSTPKDDLNTLRYPFQIIQPMLITQSHDPFTDVRPQILSRDPEPPPCVTHIVVVVNCSGVSSHSPLLRTFKSSHNSLDTIVMKEPEQLLDSEAGVKLDCLAVKDIKTIIRLEGRHQWRDIRDSVVDKNLIMAKHC